MSYFKVIEKAVKQNRFIRFIEFLKQSGFKEKSIDSSEETRRYVKRGFYDGDFPNAHQTIAAINTATYQIQDPDNNKLSLIKKWLRSENISMSTKPYRRLGPNKIAHVSHYSDTKSGFSVRITRSEYVKPILKVFVQYETTKPDLKFKRSGRGIGQII